MSTTTKADSPTSNVPDWVQANLFLDVLQNSVKGFKEIKKFSAVSGCEAGENYATIMLRVNIEVQLEDGTEKSISYMLKLPHQLEIFKKMMEQYNFFEAECSMYNTYVPELEQLYRNAGVEVKFGARAYELKNAKSDYVLLEDLAPRGFKNTDRLEGLDQAHTESALQRLAQWHAASAVRVATKGAYPERFSIGIYKEENRNMMVEMNKPLAQNFLTSCATYRGHEKYIEQVKALQPKIIDRMFEMGKVDPDSFNVLNHGDFWSNNIMFSYDANGRVKETLLVDFQMAKYGTFAQDLYYILLSSTKFEDKLSKFDHNIKYYHEELVKNLKLLKCSKAIPSLREIHMTLFKYGFLGFTTATGVMAAVLLDPSADANLENFLGDAEESKDFKAKINMNPRYRKHIEIVLPWLLNRGALDVN